MIPNNSAINSISPDNTNDNLSIKSTKSYYVQLLYIDNFYEYKEFTKFCKFVEKIIRKSNEYSAYIGNLKSKYTLNSCSFFNNIDDEKATIEMHHYPFTLYDIVAIVTLRMLKEKILKVSTFTVANEVMKLHFQNKIGLVPLCKTIHELVHAGQIFINFNQVFGKFTEFANENAEYIDETLKQNYNALLKRSLSTNDSDLETNVNILSYNNNIDIKVLQLPVEKNENLISE